MPPVRYTLTVDMTNAAFEDAPASELSRILRKCAERIEHGQHHVGGTETVRDTNGNAVGHSKLHLF